MKEEEPNWFLRCEEELPSPEELMPLSQTLITPDLAFAFDIPSPNSNQNHHQNSHGHQTPPPPPTLTQSPSQTPSSLQQQQNHHLGGDYDSSEMGGGGGSGSGGAAAGGGDEQARTLKRPRLVWTPQLHKRFVDAVSHLGIKHAVPKTIMQLMSVDGLTRENVASHLQKYRLYLKRMQGISSGAAHAAVSHSDAATEQLFASSPIPHHFLNHQRPAVGAGGGGGPEQFMPFVPVAALQRHQQMAAAAAAAHQQQQYFQHRQMGSLGSPPGGGFEHGGFLGRPQQHRQTGIQRVIGPMTIGMAPPMPSSNFVGDSDSGAGGGGRKVLTLFPTND